MNATYNKLLSGDTSVLSFVNQTLVGSDSLASFVALDFEGTGAMGAGKYAIVGYVNDNEVSANYEVTFVNGTLTVTPKVVNANWGRRNKRYLSVKQLIGRALR